MHHYKLDEKYHHDKLDEKYHHNKLDEKYHHDKLDEKYHHDKRDERWIMIKLIGIGITKDFIGNHDKIGFGLGRRKL